MVVPPPYSKQESIFVLSTPRDMLAKLAWENAQFREIMAGQQSQIGAIHFAGYQAFNCAVTAWHCADWAWASANNELKEIIADRFSLTLKPKDQSNREAFLGAVCRKSREVEICRNIANGSKHLKLDPLRDPGCHVITGAAVMPGSEKGEFVSVFGFLIIDQNRPALVENVFDRAFAYWQRLYGDLGYIEDSFVDSAPPTEKSPRR